MGQITSKLNNNEIKKHIATIHCSNTITLLQRKISNALLYHAYPELMKQEVHEINIKQLCNIIGYNGNNHKVIKEALKGLMTCLVEWNVLNEKMIEEDEWNASTILAGATIKGSRCMYSYSPQMRKLMHTPTIYGKINLIVQSKFRSSYGLALYENCVRYKGLPHTKWFELDTFRKLMGVPADKYEVFRDFKKRVLDKSVEEVNTYSDLIVEPEINRQGHKVIAIRFLLKEREKKKWLGTQMDEKGRAELLPPKTPLVEKLITVYGLTSNKVFSLFEEYSEQFILEKIELIESSNSFKSGKIKELASYLIKALQENYLPAKSAHGIHEAHRKEKEIEELQTVKRLKREADLKLHYSKYVAECINQIILNFTPKQYEQIKNSFEQELLLEKNTIVLNKFKMKGLDNKMVHAHFSQFLKSKYSVLLTEIKSIDDFKEEWESTYSHDQFELKI